MSGSKKISDKNLASFRGRKKATCFAGGRLLRHHSLGAKDFARALERGGHVRVGYEDGPFLSSGERTRSNTQLVEEVAQAAEKAGRTVVNSDRAREILGLSRSDH